MKRTARKSCWSGRPEMRDLIDRHEGTELEPHYAYGGSGHHNPRYFRDDRYRESDRTPHPYRDRSYNGRSRDRDFDGRARDRRGWYDADEDNRHRGRREDYESNLNRDRMSDVNRNRNSDDRRSGNYKSNTHRRERDRSESKGPHEKRERYEKSRDSRSSSHDSRRRSKSRDSELSSKNEPKSVVVKLAKNEEPSSEISSQENSPMRSWKNERFKKSESKKPVKNEITDLKNQSTVICESGDNDDIMTSENGTDQKLDDDILSLSNEMRSDGTSPYTNGESNEIIVTIDCEEMVANKVNKLKKMGNESIEVIKEKLRKEIKVGNNCTSELTDMKKTSSFENANKDELEKVNPSKNDINCKTVKHCQSFAPSKEDTCVLKRTDNLRKDTVSEADSIVNEANIDSSRISDKTASRESEKKTVETSSISNMSKITCTKVSEPFESNRKSNQSEHNQRGINRESDKFHQKVSTNEKENALKAHEKKESTSRKKNPEIAEALKNGEKSKTGPENTARPGCTNSHSKLENMNNSEVSDLAKSQTSSKSSAKKHTRTSNEFNEKKSDETISTGNNCKSTSSRQTANIKIQQCQENCAKSNGPEERRIEKIKELDKEGNKFKTADEKQQKNGRSCEFSSDMKEHNIVSSTIPVTSVANAEPKNIKIKTVPDFIESHTKLKTDHTNKNEPKHRRKSSEYDKQTERYMYKSVGKIASQSEHGESKLVDLNKPSEVMIENNAKISERHANNICRIDKDTNTTERKIQKMCIDSGKQSVKISTNANEEEKSINAEEKMSSARLKSDDNHSEEIPTDLRCVSSKTESVSELGSSHSSISLHFKADKDKHCIPSLTSSDTSPNLKVKNDNISSSSYDLVGQILKEGGKGSEKCNLQRSSGSSLNPSEEQNDKKKSGSSKSNILTSTPSKLVVQNEKNVEDLDERNGSLGKNKKMSLEKRKEEKCGVKSADLKKLNTGKDDNSATEKGNELPSFIKVCLDRSQTVSERVNVFEKIDKEKNQEMLFKKNIPRKSLVPEYVSKSLKTIDSVKDKIDLSPKPVNKPLSKSAKTKETVIPHKSSTKEKEASEKFVKIRSGSSNQIKLMKSRHSSPWKDKANRKQDFSPKKKNLFNKNRKRDRSPLLSKKLNVHATSKDKAGKDDKIRAASPVSNCSPKGQARTNIFESFVSHFDAAADNQSRKDLPKSHTQKEDNQKSNQKENQHRNSVKELKSLVNRKSHESKETIRSEHVKNTTLDTNAVEKERATEIKTKSISGASHANLPHCLVPLGKAALLKRTTCDKPERKTDDCLNVVQESIHDRSKHDHGNLLNNNKLSLSLEKKSVGSETIILQDVHHEQRKISNEKNEIILQDVHHEQRKNSNEKNEIILQDVHHEQRKISNEKNEIILQDVHHEQRKISNEKNEIILQDVHHEQRKNSNEKKDSDDEHCQSSQQSASSVDTLKCQAIIENCLNEDSKSSLEGNEDLCSHVQEMESITDESLSKGGSGKDEVSKQKKVNNEKEKEIMYTPVSERTNDKQNSMNLVHYSDKSMPCDVSTKMPSVITDDDIEEDDFCLIDINPFTPNPKTVTESKICKRSDLVKNPGELKINEDSHIDKTKPYSHSAYTNANCTELEGHIYEPSTSDISDDETELETRQRSCNYSLKYCDDRVFIDSTNKNCDEKTKFSESTDNIETLKACLQSTVSTSASKDESNMNIERVAEKYLPSDNSKENSQLFKRKNSSVGDTESDDSAQPKKMKMDDEACTPDKRTDASKDQSFKKQLKFLSESPLKVTPRKRHYAERLAHASKGFDEPLSPDNQAVVKEDNKTSNVYGKLKRKLSKEQCRKSNEHSKTGSESDVAVSESPSKKKKTEHKRHSESPSDIRRNEMKKALEKAKKTIKVPVNNDRKSALVTEYPSLAQEPEKPDSPESDPVDKTLEKPPIQLSECSVESTVPVLRNGFNVSHTLTLKDLRRVTTIGHLDPQKLYSNERCLLCQVCTNYFSPLEFTSHHDSPNLVSKIDAEKSMNNKYQPEHPNIIHWNEEAGKIWEEFEKLFEREKR